MGNFSNVDPDLKYVGIGIVTEDKHKDSRYIGVTLLNMFPNKTGEVSHDFEQVTRSGTDNAGNPYTATYTQGDSIIADWMKDTNNITCPDVVKGEQVEVYRLGDTHRYFWKSLGRDSTLRRTEKRVVNLVASGSKPGGLDHRHETNNYEISADSETGVITIRTSMNNGEKAGYVFLIDTMNGKFTLEDNKNNGIHLDSVKSNLRFQVKGTKNGGKEKGAPSFILLEDGIITLSAKTLKLIGDQSNTGNIEAANVNFTSVTSATTVNAQSVEDSSGTIGTTPPATP